MNFKDKLTRKLLDVGKKHRLLVYPTLALVAIITAISHAVYWGRGNGKRFVASTMIVAMLITQSLFLTSSANVTTEDGQTGETTELMVELPSEEDIDTTEEVQIITDEVTTESTTIDIINQDELNQTEENTQQLSTEETSEDLTAESSEASTEEVTENTNSVVDNTIMNSQMNLLAEPPATTDYTISLYRVDENGYQYTIPYRSDYQYVDNGDDTVSFYVPSKTEALAWYAADTGQSVDNFSSTEIYTSSSFDNLVNGGAVVRVAKTANNKYNFFIKITREKYVVNIDVNGDIYTDVVVTDSNKVAGDINPAATYTVPGVTDAPYSSGLDGGAYAWGKNYNGLTYNGTYYAIGDVIPISLTDENATGVNLTASWESQLITVNYDYVSDSDSHITVQGGEGTSKTYEYDDEISLIPADDIVSDNTGYYLSGWTDGANTYAADGITKVNSTGLATRDTLAGITADPNMIGKTLTGIWTYKDNTLVVSGDGTATDSTVSIAATYGDTISCTISAKYKMDGKANFGLLIPADEIARLNGYGLLVTANASDNGIISSYNISGELRNVTNADGISIPLTVTDYNKPVAEQNFSKTIVLVSKQKEITLDPSTIKHNNHDGAPSKPYDGNTNILVNPQAEVSGRIGADQVYVTFNTNATLDDADAGEGKAITLKDVELAGAQADMYKLTDLADGSQIVKVPGVATVTRIAVSVVSSLAEGSSDSVLFGQQTPRYTLQLANPSLLAPADKLRYDACDTVSAKEAFMKQVIGFTGEWNTTRTLYSPAGSYTITPIFSDANVNYSVSATGVTSTFTVGRDSGEGNYKLSPEPVNNYYPSLTITATGGTYDQIRLIADGTDITEGSSPSTVVSMFSSSVTITDDMTNGTIMFQMLDVDTGAITYPVTLTGINIDGSGPELVSYTVSPNVSYFNEFGFGAYYHAQNIDGVLVESVNITFEYKTDDSACDKLIYYFADENGNIKSEFNGEIKLNKNAINGNYTATVTIGTGVSGQLVVYAVDTTGNPSAQSKVKLNEAINFIKEGQSAQNYYEWMIENTINSAEIVVTDANGQGTVQDTWYNGLNFNVSASDSESGVNRITWSITDPTGTVTPITENAHDSVSMVIAGTKTGSATDYGKLTTYDFNESVSGEDALVGSYYVSAVLYDNAGNYVALEQKGPFLFDGKAPVIICDDYEADSDEYLSGVVFVFEVEEGTNESGVASVQLYYGSETDEALLGTWGPQEFYSKEITSNGTYVIVATDNAGNIARKEVTFSGISDVIPEAPVISVDGILGNDDWYINELPTVTILSQEKTSDGVPVTTTYKMTVGGNQIQSTVDSESEQLNITSEGEIVIEAWSKSKADCVSDVVTKTLKIDVNGPKVTITDSSVDEDGNTVIKFVVTDEISGVDTDEVYVNDEAVEVTDVDGVITGSFVASNNQTYKVVAKDIAGNESEATEFAPLTLQVSPVIDITPTGAYIDAKVIEGTYPISDCYIAYKKAGQSNYDTALSNKYDEEYGVRMDYTFRNLESNTVYDYKVYAITSNSNEVKVVEGSFRTADLTSTATVYGSVTYGEELPDDYKTYPVYVALYEANTVIAGVELKTEDDVDYIFKNVADGNYRIVATNGLLSEVSTVTVTNGGISYPTDYATKGGVHFVLDGLSTSVVVKDNSINITADGLDKIYNTALYNGNVTDEDLEVVAEGGTVNITLYANYITVSEIDKTTEGIFIDKIGKNGVIERYIQLYVVKEVRDAEGKLVNGTPANITRLAEPVTVSFPLGDLAGQKIYVASVHQSGSDYAYINWAGSDVALSQNYVTISTDRFSVYALYRLIETKKEYTVKWIDGDGNIMKTEIVVEGNPATPPTETPKKSETEKYTYVFSGWDTDYNSINKDTIISAWFIAKEKEVKPPTTETPPTNNKPTDDKKEDADKDDINKQPTNHPYLGSGVSPQTGDEAPIIGLIALMLASATGMILINKRKREE
ncbi:MAG: hypothetical protein IJO70_03340 [Lachnospiraceae bacterium]|nr:hypothetical protein [Lachnospiraceae bacterium]